MIFVFPETVKVDLADVITTADIPTCNRIRDLIGKLYAATNVMILGVHSEALSLDIRTIRIIRRWRPRWVDWMIDEDGIVRVVYPDKFARSEMLSDKELHHKISILNTK